MNEASMVEAGMERVKVKELRVVDGCNRRGTRRKGSSFLSASVCLLRFSGGGEEIIREREVMDF